MQLSNLLGRAAKLALAVIILGSALLASAAWYSFGFPHRSNVGSLPALTQEERELANVLRRHVDAIASEPHNLDYSQALEGAALYIERILTGYGTPDMGSVRFANMLAERHEPVSAMLSLETIGFYSDEPGSQKYPEPFGHILPSKANFISFVAMPGSRNLMHSVMNSFRASTTFPTLGGIAPGFIPGMGWSDHWSFVEAGFQAMMITDTAIFRYPHYHKTNDTPDKVDYDKLARVTKGIERAIRDLVVALPHKGPL